MIQPLSGPQAQPVTPDRLRLAADRVHRAAHVADQCGNTILASALLGTMDLLRAASTRTVTPLAVQRAEAIAAALLGDHDQEPLP